MKVQYANIALAVLTNEQRRKAKPTNELNKTLDFNAIKAISTNIAMSIMQSKEYKSKLSKNNTHRYAEEFRESIAQEEDNDFHADLFNLSNMYVQEDEKLNSNSEELNFKPNSQNTYSAEDIENLWKDLDMSQDEAWTQEYYI